MINKDYINNYRNLFTKVLSQMPKGYYDECTMPSYAHKNIFISWLFWERINSALSMLKNLQNKSILDFGCGSGVTFKYLNDNNCKITGCENQFTLLSKEMAKELNIELELYKEITEICDKKFDYIIALDSLEHVEELDIYIEKFLDLSHESTMIVISGPTESLLYRLGRLVAGFKGHYHKTNIYHIENNFERKGFKKIKIRTLYFPLTFFRVSAWKV